MPALTGWHLEYVVMIYFAGFVAAGVFCAGATGVFVAGTELPVFSMIFESVSLNVPVKLKLESNISAISIVANVQVLLSKKSVVFCTPPNI